ncbi:MAG: hypothetical protein OXC15_07400 [Rhodospirillaceae bacterium]|nr:hypothetical protein [Rhodospirillaceae bacterium]
MEFEWDGANSDACLARRGFDFAYVIRIISARKAKRKEVRDYEQNTRQD